MEQIKNLADDGLFLRAFRLLGCPGLRLNELSLTGRFAGLWIDRSHLDLAALLFWKFYGYRRSSGSDRLAWLGS